MSNNIFFFILVGFLAQMVDGALGMAYGVISNAVLLSFGVPPKNASASVHTAEMFTTAISGLSHFKLGNVQKDLFLRLIIPGVIGGVVGAYILASLPGDAIKPYIAGYLILMGLVIIYKAFRKAESRHEVTWHVLPLALLGGLCDAIGGGGWGPIVTSTLVARGHEPRFTIGSVNASEFFVTVAQVATFFATIKMGYWKITAGLLIGGVIAAPLAAFVCKKVPARPLMVMVGLLIIGLSVRTIILAL